MLSSFAKRLVPFILALVTIAWWTIAQADSPQAVQHERAKRLHQSVLTIDSHIDWPIHQTFAPSFDPGIGHPTGLLESGQWDLVRMEAGGLDAAFMSIFTPQRQLTDEGYAQAKDLANQMLQRTNQFVSKHADRVALAFTPKDADRLERAGKRALFLGMENGYPLGTDIKAVQAFYNQGIRYITLTHAKNNQLGDSATDQQQKWHGLSPFGKAVVQEMNRLGIMVDVSHVHDDTFWDVMRMTKAPIIASHSSARQLRAVPRNLDDTMLRAMKQNGGVVQLCLLGDYIKATAQSPQREAALAKLAAQQAAWFQGKLSPAAVADLLQKMQAINDQYPESKPTLANAIDHLDHLVAVMGIDHVGIGSDFDGGGGLRDLEDVSRMPRITQALLVRGYSPEAIRKIWGGNLMRVLKQVSEVSKQLQTET
ncbi:MAG: dipeptidase (plasmid) [Leptolyngbya sp. BL-A-14]